LSFLIRRAEASDGGGIYAVEVSCFQDPYPRKVLEDLLVGELNLFLVASVKEEIAGYAVATANERSGHIISIAVAPSHRRKGVGTALLRAAINGLVRGGACVVHLEVGKGNRSAIAFYERMGFAKSSEIKRYYPNGEDALVLARQIESSGTAGACCHRGLELSSG